MYSELNPYSPPASGGGEGYSEPHSVTLFHSSAVLMHQLEQGAKEGLELVTSFTVSGGGTSPYYIVWRRRSIDVSKGIATPEYRILPISRFRGLLFRRSLDRWSRAVEDEVSRFPAGWTIEAFCEPVGFVMRRLSASNLVSNDRYEYSVIERSPVWWRTLVGNSWLKVLSQELCTLPLPQSEIVAYLKHDRFLTRHPQVTEQIGRNHEGSRTYRLAMWPHWWKSIFSKTPNIAPWFNNEAALGWELVTNYQGGIFLFASTTFGHKERDYTM